jgi:hypothetical protein
MNVRFGSERDCKPQEKNNIVVSKKVKWRGKLSVSTASIL